MTPIQLQDDLDTQPAVPSNRARQNPRQAHSRFSIYLNRLGLTALQNIALAVFALLTLYGIYYAIVHKFLPDTTATQVHPGGHRPSTLRIHPSSNPRFTLRQPW
jgi:hypothetical protein